MALNESMNGLQKNGELAYKITQGKSPCVIFCPGFNSNMQGNKAVALEAFCQDQGFSFVRFDYSGHGESGGAFADGCISSWLRDVLVIIDNVVEGEVLLVGSSMGGWISLLAAQQRPKRVSGLLLIACAADMTNYYKARLTGLDLKTDAEGRQYYTLVNSYDDQQPYRIYQKLLDDGARHFLLDGPIELDIPVRLIHGMQDDVVDWQRSQQVMSNLSSTNVAMHVLKSGDHRLSTEADLMIIQFSLLELLSTLVDT